MQEIGGADLISRQQLCEAAGIDHDSLRRVRKWLFLEPAREFPGRGAGSVSYYPGTAVPMVQRFYELRSEARKIDDCIWRLWVEGYPIPIREWALIRLAPFEGGIAAAAGDHIEKIRKPVMDGLTTNPARTNPRRPVAGRLGSNAARSLMHWAIDVMAGLTPAKSLYDPDSPSFDALKKAGGLTGNWSPPDAELAVESISLSHLCNILRNATVDELDQARRDWTMIVHFVDTSDAIDWRAVRKELHVQRTSSAQPIAPVDLLIALWRDFDARGVMLAGLIHIRRSPEHSQRVSELLALIDRVIAPVARKNSPAP